MNASPNRVFELRTVEQVDEALNSVVSSRGTHFLMVSSRPLALDLLEKMGRKTMGRRHVVVSHEELSAAEIQVARHYFRQALSPGQVVLLDPKELAEVVRAESSADLFVALTYEPSTASFVFFRGDGTSLVVSASAFERTADGVSPDFSAAEIVDYGQTVKMGEYEAAVEAILYENDKSARRRMRARARDLDQSLGASIRRLRLQRGLSQADFSVGEKTIGRVERNETTPNTATRRSIALTLGVEVDDLDSF